MFNELRAYILQNDANLRVIFKFFHRKEFMIGKDSIYFV
jgi:hypothetical protein